MMRDNERVNFACAYYDYKHICAIDLGGWSLEKGRIVLMFCLDF